MSLTALSLLVPTFLVVSLTPGMCMTLSLSLGMTIGLRRTLWMMYGELIGVGSVAAASVVGVATLALQYPTISCWSSLQVDYISAFLAYSYGCRGKAGRPRRSCPDLLLV